MKILVTGAKGFVGKNLCAELKNIRDGKARCYGDLSIKEVFEYDIDSTQEELDKYCKECDFVFNLAGVNRPQNQDEFMKGNFGFASTLLDTLKKYGNRLSKDNSDNTRRLNLEETKAKIVSLEYIQNELSRK